MEDKHLIKFYAGLTTRQQQVLHLVCQGLTNKEIGYQLDIASSVVAGHLTNIYEEWFIYTEFYPNRYTLLLTFAPFFMRNPDLQDHV